MARYIIQNKVSDVAKLKDFDTAGYRFSEERSAGNKLVFLRDEQ
jgi:cytoplasmic iron level regulating protein YaaA (DUF328/UPF0246 family)